MIEEKVDNLQEESNIKESDAILRVRSSSKSKSLAASITMTLKTYHYASLRCIGDGAIGKAVKGIIIASGILKPIGIDIQVTPYFFETEINGEIKTGVAIDVVPEEMRKVELLRENKDD